MNVLTINHYYMIDNGIKIALNKYHKISNKNFNKYYIAYKLKLQLNEILVYCY